MESGTREDMWADWMRRAIAGDGTAYHRFLASVTPHLRAMARGRCQQFGVPVSEAEDIVQEVLLALHQKRGTWDPDRPIGPWLSVIVRNKLIDGLRRRGRYVSLPLEDVAETLEAAGGEISARLDVESLLARLKDPQRSIVRAISLEGRDVREIALGLSMTEGAVRVALHRALKTLSALCMGEAG